MYDQDLNRCTIIIVKIVANNLKRKRNEMIIKISVL